MKRFAMFILAASLTICSGSTFAQTDLKFAHINGQELLSIMPERDSAEVKLNAYGQDLSDQIEELHVEYNNKLQTYMQRRETLSEAIRQVREKELTELQQRIQEFEQTAQQEFQRMQGELMRPLMEKADAAIKKVAKQEGLIYVFDISTGGVVYFSEQSVDLLPLVKAELGIK
ncbi:MAG TPA: OmpH family outer membrane protein [Perlabentimonas sp.]|nr:OmpH family outer membrane protein [Bacteroidales bacterium]MDD4673329.1 OmpH family outer membrane protein [Bacteroidales bacterium]MDY0349297.1 OmpH family outer membrane protein [Tenuifilaceae bacterium]HZJ74695.1 OmpH family outer membrane protein [Perlabentimonas sp.]